MTPIDYYLLAIKNKCYLYRGFFIDVFTIPDLPSTVPDELEYPMQLIQQEGQLAYVSNDKAVVPIEHDIGTPLLKLMDNVTVTPDVLSNVSEPTDTVAGNVFVNGLAFDHCLNGLIPFMTGEITPSRIERAVAPLVVDTPEEGEDRDPGMIYADMALAMQDAVWSFYGLGQYIIPTGTEYAITPSEAIQKLKIGMLNEFKDQLNDPAIVAKIAKVIEEADREYMSKDPGKGYYITNKSFAVTRMKMYGMIGLQAKFDGDGFDLITTSISDGIDLNNLPPLFNKLRDGSYNRGLMTAFGGVAVNELNNRFQDTTIPEDDCGTKIGLPTKITKDNLSDYIDHYMIDDEGVTTLLTQELLTSFMGKVIMIRNPGFCHTVNENVCGKCMGKALAANPDGLTSEMSSVGSRFQNIRMKWMHGKALSTAHYDIKENLQ